MVLAAVSQNLSAENYVNWKGNFWFSVPDEWEKVDYRLFDSYVAFSDTTREVLDYEVVYAPSSSPVFAADAYMVVTFEETGELSKRESDSILKAIAEAYSTEVYDAPVVQLLSDLVPGRPKINREKKVVSVLSDMALRPDAMIKVWQYMRLNDLGLISLFFYSPDSTFERNKPVFDQIVSSLSFENLKAAADQEQLTFTEVGGEDMSDPEVGSELSESSGDSAAEEVGNFRDILLYAVVIIVVFGLIWNFVILPRKKKKTQSE
jgi:hypothetical protein